MTSVLNVNSKFLLGSDRSEDLSAEQVLNLFAGTGGDETAVERLMSPGTSLLQGSRGTGKTMLLRVASERIKLERKNVLPIFISFAQYLATYNTNARKERGYSAFQNWILAKLLAGVRDNANELKPKGAPLKDIFGPVPLDMYIKRLETHYQDVSVADPSRNAAELGVSASDLVDFARLDKLQAKVLAALSRYGFESVVFFLDEAAQNFAEELQPEFFQIIKHLRHHQISVKAAVYPNTTNYGRDFDVGQDAIVIPLERPVESEEGMAFFQELVKKRFADSDIGRVLGSSEVQTQFLIKMSGGNPRWLIHLLNGIDYSSKATIQREQAMAVAKTFPDTTLWPYLVNLRIRLRSKRKYVEAALDLAQTLVEGLREANKSLRRETSERPICYVAVSNHKTVPFRVHAALKMLQYAGIILSRGPRRITGRDTAEMFLIHPAILVKENALFGGETNIPLESVVTALSDPLRERFREYTKNSPRLLEFRQDKEEDIGACENCGSPLAPDAKFCSQCGTSTSKKSPFEELLSEPSSKLELTPGIKARLVADTRFPTVGHVFRATDAQLDSIFGIGEARIPFIKYAVEEFLSG